MTVTDRLIQLSVVLPNSQANPWAELCTVITINNAKTAMRRKKHPHIAVWIRNDDFNSPMTPDYIVF